MWRGTWRETVKIELSNGAEHEARLEVWDDLSVSGRAYRLFWASPDGKTGTPAVGYCSSGGTYRTIRAAVADGLRRFGERAVRA